MADDKRRGGIGEYYGTDDCVCTGQFAGTGADYPGVFMVRGWHLCGTSETRDGASQTGKL